MILTQLYTGCLSQAAYLIADEASRQAVLVDPLRDVDQYLVRLNELDLKLVGVILTHFHADFVSGHLELAAATGAWIGMGDRARAEFGARLLSDGERIPLGPAQDRKGDEAHPGIGAAQGVSGDLRAAEEGREIVDASRSHSADGVVLEIMHTPGHTPESISVLVYEHGGGTPIAVLTGDTLFIGDVGRVDLLASLGCDPIQLAVEQHDSVQRLMTLPDGVRVFPAHGAGSSCGRNLSEERSSTIGTERAANPGCAPMSREDFVAYVSEGQTVPPAYFTEDATLNRHLRSLFSVAAAHRVLDMAQLDAAVEAGATVLDVRNQDDFAAGFLPGALNVPLVGRFAETAGMFLELSRPLVVAFSETGVEVELVSRLGRIGIDNIVGLVDATGLARLAEAGRLSTAWRLSPAELAGLLSDAELIDTSVDANALVVESTNIAYTVGELGDAMVLDVRSALDHAGGCVPGAVNVPLPQLARRVDELPRERPVVVHCETGWRSSVAASWLRAQGFSACDLRGGYRAWADWVRMAPSLVDAPDLIRGARGIAGRRRLPQLSSPVRR